MHAKMTVSLTVMILAVVPFWDVGVAMDYSFQYIFRSTRSVCKSIPNTLTLCHGVGYTEMRLPNLLGHDTMKEVQQQSSAWVPLLSKQCHRDTKKFLCSLFTPVCLLDLTEPIQPCKSLCETVRNGCLPVMSAFGFPWPDMFNCSQFPSDPELCIPATGAIDAKENGRNGNETHFEGLVVCDACGHATKGEMEIRLNYCRSNFALKFRVSESSVEGSDRKIMAHLRTLTMLKGSMGTEEDYMAKSTLWLHDGGRCTCEELDDLSTGSFVALGNFEGRRSMLSHLVRWTKTERELRKFIRSLQRQKC